MNKTELAMRRRNVRAFIQADPVELILSRPGVVIKSAVGGTTRSAPEDLPSQQFRIVQNVRRYTDGLVNAEAGDIPRTKYLMIGEHTRDVEEDDHFWWLDEHYKVTGIFGPRQESLLIALEYYGKRNRDA